METKCICLFSNSHL